MKKQMWRLKRNIAHNNAMKRMDISTALSLTAEFGVLIHGVVRCVFSADVGIHKNQYLYLVTDTHFYEVVIGLTNKISCLYCKYPLVLDETNMYDLQYGPDFDNLPKVDTYYLTSVNDDRLVWENESDGNKVVLNRQLGSAIHGFTITYEKGLQ